MHILCTICSDLMNQADSMYVTKCGHVFHHKCLTQWIARSTSCPQCRNKVTDRCMFRLYLTISNENTTDDAATLQSRLDDIQLQLREQKGLLSEKDIQLATNEAELKKNQALLKTCEKKLVSRDSAVSALKDQLEYVKIENRELHKLKDENESLKKNIQTLNGLQRVLYATSDEVEVMLEGYSDIRTVATFATALKRALCESESKKNESRDHLQTFKQQLTVERSAVMELQAKLRLAEEQIQTLKYEKEKCQDKKRDAEEAFGDANIENAKVQRVEEPENTVPPSNNNSFTNLVNSIEASDSPYLRLKHSNLALTALQQRHPPNVPNKSIKPSEFGILNAAKDTIYKQSRQFNVQKKKSDTFNTQNLSIFHVKETTKVDLDKYERVDLDISYDGLGGHSKPYVFPASYTKQTTKALIPKLSAKHKLKRPNTAGSQDISKMLEKIKDNNL